MKMIRITSDWYCAGAVVNDNGKIIRAAPILGRFIGKSAQRLIDYAKLRKFKVEMWDVKN